jgi:Fur family ferric uptake transcriptional regulator
MTPFINLFRRYLREQGLPITQQREVVADVVFSTPGHLSVEDIEVALKGLGERIGKATIYRTMEILVRSGLVKEHDFGEGFKRYEHLFGHQPVHEHLICTSCSEVIEFQSPEVVRLQEETATRHGFLATRHRLEIYGLCAACQARGVTIAYEGLTCPVDMLT